MIGVAPRAGGWIETSSLSHMDESLASYPQPQQKNARSIKPRAFQSLSCPACTQAGRWQKNPSGQYASSTAPLLALDALKANFACTPRV